MLPEMKEALVIGGGFAGLSVAIELARSSKIKITLIDRNDCFLNTLALHKTHTISLSKLQIPYSKLADKHSFIFKQMAFPDSLHSLAKRERDKQYMVEGFDVPFDYIIICTGSETSHFQMNPTSTLIDLESLKQKELSVHLKSDVTNICVIGGGATGIQYAFELRNQSKRSHNYNVTVITTQAGLLDQFPGKFGSYAHLKTQKNKIRVHYLARVLDIAENELTILQADESQKRLPFDLAFNFSGIKASPTMQNCDQFGRVLVDGQIITGLYAAGDNSHFQGTGLNSATAQAAVRKGRTVADHIVNSGTKRKTNAYTYNSLGYFVSLGEGDGIGWLLNQNAITTGLAAYLIKESIEYQFKLFLDGFDTYI